MGIFAVIFLLTIAIILFVAAKLKWIPSDTIQLVANIAAIVALLAAVAVFIIPPAVKPTETPTATTLPPLPRQTDSPTETATAFISPTTLPSTSPVSQLPLASYALFDKFDSSSGSYDTTLWACLADCNIKNLSVKDGVLVMSLSNSRSDGTTGLVSRSEWNYRDLESLKGKFKISSTAKQGETGWLSLPNDTGCSFHGTETPFLECGVGQYTGVNSQEYITNDIPIKFDTWYSLTIYFNMNFTVVRFYLNDILIGEHSPEKHPDTVNITTGIYSPVNESPGVFYIDDVILTLNK